MLCEFDKKIEAIAGQPNVKEIYENIKLMRKVTLLTFYLIAKFLSLGFFFSYSYDLTKSMQNQENKDPDDRFM